MRAHTFHLQLIEDFNLTSVLIIRSLAEAIVSLTDHFSEHGGFGMFDQTAYIQKHFNTWADAKKLDYMITMVLPWYLLYLQEWQEIDSPSFLKVDYDYITQKPEKFIKLFAKYFNIKPVVSPEELQAFVNKRTDVNYTGYDPQRWKKRLSQAQLQRMEEMAAIYGLENYMYSTKGWMKAEHINPLAKLKKLVTH